MKRNWKLFKNTEIDTSDCWQLYYVEEDGRKRYYGESLTYPMAAALRDALMDDDIRMYAVNHVLLPIKDCHKHTMANKATYDTMIHLIDKYSPNSYDSVYERMIVKAINAE